jgi:hypothetical protein
MLFSHLYPSLSPDLFLSHICFMCNTGHEMNTEMFSQKKNSFVKHDSNGVHIYLIQLSMILTACLIQHRQLLCRQICGTLHVSALIFS